MIPAFESLLPELSEAEVYESHSVDISDLFDVPFMITFNGETDPEAYQFTMESRTRDFQRALNDHLESLPSLMAQAGLLSEMHFELTELRQNFYQRSVGQNDKQITIPGHYRMKLTRYEQDELAPIMHIRIALFITIQQKAVERLIRYVEHRMNTIHINVSLVESDQRTELLNNLNLLYNSGEIDGSEAITKPAEKIRWNSSPREFVELFADLINSGKFGIGPGNHSDTEPIVRQLHTFFYIPKAKGEGEVSAGTLSTYFKKHNTGEDF